MLTKSERRTRIKMRVRKKVNGTGEMPRMSVFRSNRQIYVQFVDDVKGITIAAASSKDKELADKLTGNKSEVAAIVGKAAAEKAIAAGITKVAFDRNGYLYHGRVKQLADAAREAGLKF